MPITLKSFRSRMGQTITEFLRRWRKSKRRRKGTPGDVSPKDRPELVPERKRLSKRVRDAVLRALIRERERKRAKR